MGGHQLSRSEILVQGLWSASRRQRDLTVALPVRFSQFKSQFTHLNDTVC